MPLLYIISGEEGAWGVIFPWSGDHCMVDEARVKIEEVTYDLEDEQRIENKFNELNMSINFHDHLLLPEQMQSFTDVLINA